MTRQEKQKTVLIIEDGDEYLDNLSRLVPGPKYRQAQSAKGAVEILRSAAIDLIYLDMRFDRVPRSHLTGDLDAVVKQKNGNLERAWKYLQDHQGLYILDKLRKENLLRLPVILAYDFSGELRRFAHLQTTYPTLRWVPDAITATQISNLMDELLG